MAAALYNNGKSVAGMYFVSATASPNARANFNLGAASQAVCLASVNLGS